MDMDIPHAGELASRLSSMGQFKPAAEELLLMLRCEVRPETFRMQTRKVDSPLVFDCDRISLTAYAAMVILQIVTLIEVRRCIHVVAYQWMLTRALCPFLVCITYRSRVQRSREQGSSYTLSHRVHRYCAPPRNSTLSCCGPSGYDAGQSPK